MESLYCNFLNAYLCNTPHFVWVYWRKKPTQDVGRTLEKLVNHEPDTSDLQASRVFSQHPKWEYYAGKPTENAVYYFYKTIVRSSNFLGV